MYSGIYLIKNIINNKVYVGQAVNILKRIRKHIDSLTNNKHINKHLQRSFNKYGIENFEYSVVCSVPVEQLNLAEKSAIYMFTSTNPLFGFNKTTGGEGGIPTEEIRKKISEATTGKPKSEEHKKKLSKALTGEKSPMFGKHLSEETRKKMSANHADMSGKKNPNFGRTGEKHPLFGKPAHNKGKPMPEEQKKKISKANIGRIPPNKGKPVSEEQKKKISETLSKTTYKITKPDGTVEIIKNLNQYCKKNGLNHSSVYQVALGRIKQHKDFMVEKVLKTKEKKNE